LPNPNKVLPSKYFQDEFVQVVAIGIAHWGYVNSTRQEAEHSHQIAVAIITILREMDRFENMELPEFMGP